MQPNRDRDFDPNTANQDDADRTVDQANGNDANQAADQDDSTGTGGAHRERPAR